MAGSTIGIRHLIIIQLEESIPRLIESAFIISFRVIRIVFIFGVRFISGL